MMRPRSLPDRLADGAAELQALSGAELVDRCRALESAPAAVVELIRRLDAFLEDEGNQALAVHLRLPRTANELRLHRRDTWIGRAARTIAAPNAWQGCITLEQAWKRYVERGSFARVRSLPLHPTRHERSLEACLFHATVANEGRALKRTRLHQIAELRSVWGVEVGTGRAEESLSSEKALAHQEEVVP